MERRWRSGVVPLRRDARRAMKRQTAEHGLIQLACEALNVSSMTGHGSCRVYCAGDVQRM